MRVQVRRGSRAERRYYRHSTLPGNPWPASRNSTRSVDPSPLDDLMFHGGKLVPQMQYQNLYLGGERSWSSADVDAIEGALECAMCDQRLDNVMRQYFPGRALSCDTRPALILEQARPRTLGEAEVQRLLLGLFEERAIARRDLAATIFNFILPAGAVLRLNGSSSLSGLGGYHGSLRIPGRARGTVIYYSASVYSKFDVFGRENGVVVFDCPWKNVVATLYHQLNEFRTNPDVCDAVRMGENELLGWMSRWGQEVGDQPIFAAQDVKEAFGEIRSASRRSSSRRAAVPVQFMYSNAAHRAEGPIPRPHAEPR